MPVPHDKKYTSDEFFKLMPENDAERFELRNGEIVALASPSEIHQDITGGLFTEILNYIRKNKGECKPIISPFDVKLSDFNVVIPDIFVVCDRSKLDGKRCNGSPDWIIEVLSTNRRDDLIIKLALYQEFGVREYWIVDPKNQKTLVYFFEKSDLPNIYTFDTLIPVNIYNGKLEIKISDLII